MKPRLTVITLGVRDVAIAKKFYCEGLGWAPAEGSNEHITFINAGGVVLALFARQSLAADAKLEDKNAGGFAGFTLAHNVATRNEVDEALLDAKRAGAKILKTAEVAFWGGYSGYFADPDGNAWEVAHNPHWQLDARGRVMLPQS